MTALTDAILAETPAPDHPAVGPLAALILDLDDIDGWDWARAEPMTPAPDTHFATRWVVEAVEAEDGVAHAAMLLAAEARLHSW